MTAKAQHLVREWSRGKFHLSMDDRTALCGAEASTPFGFAHHGEREAFDNARLQHHYCKRCVKRES